MSLSQAMSLRWSRCHQKGRTQNAAQSAATTPVVANQVNAARLGRSTNATNEATSA